MVTSIFPATTEVVGLRDAMDRLLADAVVGGPFRTLSSRAGQGLPLDAYVTDEQAVVLAAIPGLNPNDLEVTVTQGTLTLSGTIPSATESAEGKGAAWLLHEIPHGQFRRSLTLPFAVDADRVEATFQNGLVRIVLPQAEAAKPRRIPIQAGNQPQAVGAGNSAKTS